MINTEIIKSTIINLLKNSHRKNMDKLIEYLISSDYFTAPASTKYHSNIPSSLAMHSLNVRNLIAEKNERFNLGIPEETVNIAGLLHDFCKIDFYTTGKRWLKDSNGTWKSYDTYLCKDNFPIGHGEKSVIMIQKYIELTDVEIMMIRWHMGTSEEFCNIRSYFNAASKYPQIVIMQTSDFEASQLLEEIKPFKKN